MMNPINKVCLLGVFIFAASFWSCSTDSDVVAIGDEDLNGLHIVDDSVFDEDPADDNEAEDVKASSSSKKQTEKSSSSSKKSSASNSSEKSVISTVTAAAGSPTAQESMLPYMSALTQWCLEMPHLQAM